MNSPHEGWRKSSYSAPNGDCVEVGYSATGMIALRDSKQGGTGPVLDFTRREWTAFMRAIRTTNL